MRKPSRSDASIQAFFSSTPTRTHSPLKTSSPQPPPHQNSSDTIVGDGFTPDEVKEALKPRPTESWHPSTHYTDSDIKDLLPGKHAVSFTGRVANIFDVTIHANSHKTPRSAKGCLKLCVKDDGGAITLRLWYAELLPRVRLGELVSIWTTHISNGDHGAFGGASSGTPLFASIFPERDRSCHLEVHADGDDNGVCNTPLGYREGLPLAGVMTLQNFVDGGYDVVGARILVVVKSTGVKKKVIRKDNSSTENVNLQVHDDTAEATLGLWGTCAQSPFGTASKIQAIDCSEVDAAATKRSWVPGETVLLIQAPGWKIGTNTYLSITAATVIDINPSIPDTSWLRRWSLRLKSREAINPPFPEEAEGGIFDSNTLTSNPIRPLFTLAELDSFARCTNETETAIEMQGYLSLLITEVKLLDYFKRAMLFCTSCPTCNLHHFANAIIAVCKGCSQTISLRLNPRILEALVDETGAVASGKLLFSDRAWRDLLGREPEQLLRLSPQELRLLSDRLLFCRVTVMFAWSGDESVRSGGCGGRICVLRVCA